MSYYRSSETIMKNSDKWKTNLEIDTTKRRDIPVILVLSSYSRLPSKNDIIGRYHTLFSDAKDRKTRIIMITDELIDLWKKFSFPTLSKQVIKSKLLTVIAAYNKNRKKKTDCFEKEKECLFDITKTDGAWLCQEDRKLYNSQVKSNGKIGYVTNKEAPKSSIHPSKRIRKPNESPYNIIHKDEHSTQTDDAETDTMLTVTSSESGESETNKQKKCSTSHAVNLVTMNTLSTNKAAVVCASLASNGLNVPSPSQSGVWRATIRKGENAKLQIKSILQKERNFCLHFDGKRISNNEYQVVCLKSSLMELKFGILKCDSGSSQDIFNALERLLNEFDAWGNFKMIICDTTAVNTGKVKGVVVKLQNGMISRGFPRAQYIGCQHHILDRILKHILDFFIPTFTTKPTLNYKFVDDIIGKYDILIKKYKPQKEMEIYQNLGWRDDFKFLFELCVAFRFFKENGNYPVIKWRKLPSLNNARWNSRAIYALLCYFLIPKWRIALELPCCFISTTWQEVWFSNQMFHETVYQNLMDSISQLNCSAALKCFKTHWSSEQSILDIPRTNICAERAVKVMEDLQSKGKTDKYLSLKFIATNKF